MASKPCVSELDFTNTPHTSSNIKALARSVNKGDISSTELTGSLKAHDSCSFDTNIA